MELWQNLPVALIVLPLVCAPICSVSKPRMARFLALFASVFAVLMSVMLIVNVADLGTSYVYKMGEFGAPFGNELFISGAEASISLMFSVVMALSLFAGLRRIGQEIDDHRKSLFYTVCVLLLTAIQALAFTNDIFTGFVFLEITTIAAGALIFVRSKEGSLFAAMRYMIMNLLGSGLFLLGI
ncbi:MAG: sodium:proton antiporter, partial [Clostridia bacterium]|nr:sodium:proton antiporter [Clostridia bacterium]